MDKSQKIKLGLVVTLWFAIFVGLYSFFLPDLPDLHFSHDCEALDYNSLKCDRSSDREQANAITENRLTQINKTSRALERVSKFDPGLLNYSFIVSGNASVRVTNDSGFQQTFIPARICGRINNEKIIEDGGGHYIRYSEDHIGIKDIIVRYSEATEVIDNCIISHPQITLGTGENISNVEEAVENSEVYTFKLRMDGLSLFILFIFSIILCRYALGIILYFLDFVFKKQPIIG